MSTRLYNLALKEEGPSGGDDPSTVEDVELLRRARDGDSTAYDVLVRRWEGRLHGFVCRYLGDPEEARDVCQETFLRVFRDRARLSEGQALGPWLYRVAVNLCIDRQRRVKTRSALTKRYLMPQKRSAWREAMDIDGEPGAHLLRSERAAAVRRALGRLGEQQRMAVLLKEYQGMTFEEIAATTGEPVSTIKSRLYRGLARLRTLLEKEFGHPVSQESTEA